MAQYRTVDLECPFQSPSDNLATDAPLPTPTPPSTTKDGIGPSAVPKPKIFCSSHEMTVELPFGPISEIVVKGVCICVVVYAFQVHMFAIISA